MPNLSIELTSLVMHSERSHRVLAALTECDKWLTGVIPCKVEIAGDALLSWPVVSFHCGLD